MTDSWVISCEIPLSWISLNLTDDKSTLVQVMAWCRQATSHYLNQCWPKSMSPYGITRPQWVNVMRKERLRQRKRDKKATARYCSMSSFGFCIYVAGFRWRGRLGLQRVWVKLQNSQVCCEGRQAITSSLGQGCGLSTQKTFQEGLHVGEWGRSWEMDRQGCYSRDWSDSGLMDEGRRDQDDGSRSTGDTDDAGSHSPSRSRATAEQKHSAGTECCEDWSTANAGSVGASFSGSWCTAKQTHSSDGASSSLKEVTESLMSSPVGPVLCRVHATVDNILSAGSFENQTQDDWTLSSDGTPAVQMGPTASHKSCPAGLSPLGKPATIDKLRSARLSENLISTVAPFSLLVGMDQPGDPVGLALDPYQASRGLDTVSAVSSETQTDVCSAMDDNTNEITQIGADSVSQDRDTPPVKATGAVTSAGPAGIKQPGVMNLGQYLLNPAARRCWQLCNKHWGCLQYPIIMTWHLPRTFALETFQ